MNPPEGVGLGLGFALQPFAPSVVKPAEQAPHEATPRVLVHARLASQPPLFALHASGYLQPVAPSLIRGAEQSPHVATPSLLVHERLASQPPFSITHLSTHCAVFTASAFPVGEGFLFSQQVLKWLQYPLLKNVVLLHFGASSQDFWHVAKSGWLPDEAVNKTSPFPVSHS